MNFLIADTFTDSLARLTGDEQKAVKTTAFDLQLDPSAPGLSFHKLDKAKDKRFWSVRVNADIRLIVHKTDASLLLCYVDHHDRAYAWGERRKLETHPTTGAAQIIELRESVREIAVPTYMHSVAPPKAISRPLADTSDQVLLKYGVPAEWLKDVRDADEDGLLALTGHLPAEAAEAILELATGGIPHVTKAEPTLAGLVPDPFTHPDAQRRFRVVTSVEELERALDAPWDKWAVFLHPEQRQLVTRDYSGPARVAGSAGTGKTVVALHRAVHLARTMPEGRILLTTFSERTSHQIREQADRLLGPEILDADGNREERRHTVSVFNGPPPQIRTFATEPEESEAIGAWLRSLCDDGVQPHEVGVFVRSSAQVSRATAAVTAAGLSASVLDDRVQIKQGTMNVATMHLAKGLEFRAVAVMACDDEVLPLQDRIETVGDDGDLQEVYDTERQLLYVACTRARDRLSISAVVPASEFLDDVRV